MEILMNESLAVLCFLLCFVSSAALSDLRTGKIPNRLILCGLLGGMLSLLPMPGVFPVCALSDALCGFLLPYLLLGVPSSLGMIGGGDVKLLSVIGLFLGAKACAQVLLLSFPPAGLAALCLVLRRRCLRTRLLYLSAYLGACRAGKRPQSYRKSCRENSDGLSSGEFCFSPAVLAGLSAYLTGLRIP